MESSKDIKFITDETLDFELFSSLDDTDCCYRQEKGESTACPLELGDKRAAQAVDLNILLEENDGRTKETIPQWSLLTPMKLEIMKEANLLAMQFEKCQLLEKQNISSGTKLETVLEHELLPPIRFLSAERKSSQNSRRRTFNVKNSPLQALLPTVEPVTCLAQGSPGSQFPEGRSPSSRLADLPSPRRLQNTSCVCSTDVPQAKLSEPKALMTMTSGNKKLQETIGNNRTDKPLVLPTATKGQQPLPHLKPLPEARIRKMQRKTEASAKNRPVQGPQLQETIGNNRTDKPLVLPTATKGQQPLPHLKPLPEASISKMQRKTEASAKNRPVQGPQISFNQGTEFAPQVKGKPNPQMRLWQTSPVKEIPAAPEKMAPLQKTNASQVKTVGGNGPPKQASSKPRGGSCQIQTRHAAVPALESRLPKPTTHPAAVSGRYTIPGKSNQFKPLSSEASGGQRSFKPAAGAGKKASCQKPVPPGTLQKSRLRLPKTSSNSK